MALAPFITRLYGPTAFGELGAFTALLSVALPLAALGYPIAIVLPASHREAKGLVKLSFSLSILIALLAFLLIFSGGDTLATAFGANSIANYLPLLPFAMLFSAWAQIAQQWLIRNKNFICIARASITQSIVINSLKIAGGLITPTAFFLIITTTLGNAIHALLLFLCTRSNKKDHNILDHTEKQKSLHELAGQHRDFPLYRAPQDFINATSQSLPILMLAAFFGPESAGYYTLSKLVMGVPSSLVGKAFSDVFYPRITEAARNKENLTKSITHSTAILFGIGIIPFSLIMAFGPLIFSFAFGTEWSPSGSYAQWLALFFFFNFINKPSVAAAPALGIQRGLLIYEIFSTTGKTLGLIVGFYWFRDDTVAIALFSAIGVAAYCALIVWILSHALRFEKNAKTSS